MLCLYNICCINDTKYLCCIYTTNCYICTTSVAFVLLLYLYDICCIKDTSVVLKRQGKYSHSRSLTSHLCNICCIFATPQLSPCLVPCPLMQHLLYLYHISRWGGDTPSHYRLLILRLTNKSERIWEKQLFTRVFLEIWRCGEGLKTLFSVYY